MSFLVVLLVVLAYGKAIAWGPCDYKIQLPNEFCVIVRPGQPNVLARRAQGHSYYEITSGVSLYGCVSHLICGQLVNGIYFVYDIETGKLASFKTEHSYCENIMRYGYEPLYLMQPAYEDAAAFSQQSGNDWWDTYLGSIVVWVITGLLALGALWSVLVVVRHGKMH